MAIVAKTSNIAYFISTAIFLLNNMVVILNMPFATDEASAILYITDVFFIIFITVEFTFTIFPISNVFILQLLKVKANSFNCNTINWKKPFDFFNSQYVHLNQLSCGRSNPIIFSFAIIEFCFFTFNYFMSNGFIHSWI